MTRQPVIDGTQGMTLIMSPFTDTSLMSATSPTRILKRSSTDIVQRDSILWVSMISHTNNLGLKLDVHGPTLLGDDKANQVLWRYYNGQTLLVIV
jgi:hypothetical protein